MKKLLIFVALCAYAQTKTTVGAALVQTTIGNDLECTVFAPVLAGAGALHLFCYTNSTPTPNVWNVLITDRPQILPTREREGFSQIYQVPATNSQGSAAVSWLFEMVNGEVWFWWTTHAQDGTTVHVFKLVAGLFQALN